MEYIVEQTELFEKWHESVKDQKAKIAIARRIERVEHGNLGDAKTLGNGISEMRIDMGAGYRFTLPYEKKSLLFYWPEERKPHNSQILEKLLN